MSPPTRRSGPRSDGVKAAGIGVLALVLAVYPQVATSLADALVGRDVAALVAAVIPLALAVVVVWLIRGNAPLPAQGRGPWILAAVSASVAALIGGIFLAVALLRLVLS